MSRGQVLTQEKNGQNHGDHDAELMHRRDFGCFAKLQGTEISVIFQASAREMPSLCILEISVVRCNPSLAAAPLGPPMTQLVSASA